MYAKSWWEPHLPYSMAPQQGKGGRGWAQRLAARSKGNLHSRLCLRKSWETARGTTGSCIRKCSRPLSVADMSKITCIKASLLRLSHIWGKGPSARKRKGIYPKGTEPPCMGSTLRASSPAAWDQTPPQKGSESHWAVGKFHLTPVSALAPSPAPPPAKMIPARVPCEKMWLASMSSVALHQKHEHTQSVSGHPFKTMLGNCFT